MSKNVTDKGLYNPKSLTSKNVTDAGPEQPFRCLDSLIDTYIFKTVLLIMILIDISNTPTDWLDRHLAEGGEEAKQK